jgi:hypothetical protein
MLERLTENKPLMRKIGMTCVVLGVILLLVIGANFVLPPDLTWIQVSPAYIPLIVIDIIIGAVMIKQGKEETYF